MTAPSPPTPSRFLAPLALGLAFLAHAIPIAYGVYGLFAPMLWGGPLFFPLLGSIPFVSAIAVLAAAIALLRHAPNRSLAVFAIPIAVAAPVWHLAFCMTLTFGYAGFHCPMVWGVAIP